MTRRRLGNVFDDDPKYTDRFGLLLVLAILSVTMLSLVDLNSPVGNARSELGWIAVTVVVGATLLLALRASGVKRGIRLFSEIAVAGAIGLSIIAIAIDNFTAADLGNVVSTQPGWLWVLLAAMAPVVVVRRLLKHQEVTRHTLAGAISAFMLIALLADYAFLTVDSVGDTPFFGTEEPTTVFMYYSLVTITTLGYGDFSAATDVGRLLSTVEAVFGQIFLVTFVASIVSMGTTRIARERREAAARRDSSDDAP